MNRFKELRKKNGYNSQKALADKLFVNQTAVSQWERGATTPSTDMLGTLSKLYGVSIDYLLGRTNDPGNNNTSAQKAEVTEEDIKFALFEGSDDITDDMYEDVKAYARFIKERKRKNDNSDPV